jgi:hypothetical protein
MPHPVDSAGRGFRWTPVWFVCPLWSAVLKSDKYKGCVPYGVLGCICVLQLNSRVYAPRYMYRVDCNVFGEQGTLLGSYKAVCVASSESCGGHTLLCRTWYIVLFF